MVELDTPPPLVRYGYPAPGGLLHLDVKKLGRSEQLGVRATGVRTARNPGAGVESLHVAINGHSRVAFACLHPNEKQPSVVEALRQAVAFYAGRGVSVQRVLTDRGASYRSRLFARTCRELGLKHVFTRPYRPQTNGKAERFIQTGSRFVGLCPRPRFQRRTRYLPASLLTRRQPPSLTLRS